MTASFRKLPHPPLHTNGGAVNDDAGDPAIRESDGPAGPHVLIYDPDRAQGLMIATRIRCSVCAGAVTRLTERVDSAELRGDIIDVCLINLAGERLDGLAFGAELCVRFPWIETVFWFDESAGAPAAEAARSIGIRRLIPLTRLSDWLDRALPLLGRIARARREQLNAETALPPVPLADGVEITLPLPEAERRFREAYLRRMLSDSSSHSVAARKAGLAYTTFRSMLKKMDIE